MKFSRSFMTMFLAFSTSIAAACPGGYYRINADTALTGDSVLTNLDPQVSVPAKELLGRELEAADGKGHTTHLFKVLGQNTDAQGKVLSTIYLVKNLETGVEKVIVLGQPQEGERGLPRVLRGSFSSLLEMGC